MQMKRKSKKRIVPLLNYNVNSFNDYQIICNSMDTRKIVFNNLVDAIEDSIKTKKREASIFMIDFDHYVSLGSNSWERSLKTAIEFFSSDEIEDYEMCQKCVSLIDKIKGREDKPVSYGERV
jgi:hypothetical protein